MGMIPIRQSLRDSLAALTAPQQEDSMSRALKTLLAAGAFAGMAVFIVAHAPPARAQDQATAPADDLPPGPDHDLVKTTCTMCHQASQFDTLRKDEAGWTDIVNEMGAMGAVIPDENVPKIVAYLTAHFGPDAAAPGAAPGGPTPAQGAVDGVPATPVPDTPPPAPAQ
jgi:hypothetical protein